MSELSYIHAIIKELTPQKIKELVRPHAFSVHRAHRFLNTLSNLDLFAAELVTYVMRSQQYPLIPSIYFGCVGQPPKSWLNQIILEKVTIMCPILCSLDEVKAILKNDDLTYEGFLTAISNFLSIGKLHFYLVNRQLLAHLVQVAVLGALAYGKGLKRAPNASINLIRYVFYVYRMSGVNDDDLYEALMCSNDLMCQDTKRGVFEKHDGLSDHKKSDSPKKRSDSKDLMMFDSTGWGTVSTD